MIAAPAAITALTQRHARALRSRLAPVAAIDGVHCVALIDRAGRLLVSQGFPPGIELESLATLSAADFNANEQLARLVGEHEFHTVIRRGSRVSLDMEDVRGCALVVTLSDVSVQPGLVLRATRWLASNLAPVLEDMLESQRTHHRTAPLAGAEEEIDRMFEW